MKKYSLFLLATLMLFVSCDDDDVSAPIASFTISETNVSVNETVTFSFTGEGAKQVVIYPGDKGHDYELKSEGNTGFVVNKGTITYSYKKAGIYKAVLVASNYDKKGDEIVFSTTELTVTVADNRADLKNISLKKDVFNKELLGQIIDNKILFTIPYKVRVSNTDVAVNVSQQRIEAGTVSDAALLTFNGLPYSATTKYNLTNPLSIKIVSPAGDTNEYQVEMLRFPIFETFNINGVSGVVKYSDFDFDKTFVTVTLPVGTDVKALSPIFSSNDAKTVFVNDVAQVSGQTTNDFTQPVTYVLKTWKDGEEDSILCESTVEVSVLFK